MRPGARAGLFVPLLLVCSSAEIFSSEKPLEPISFSTAASILTAPALAPNPPAMVGPNETELPLVNLDGEWKGFRCGIQKAGSAVFRDAAEWDRFWQIVMAPYEKKLTVTPKIDFSKEMVVGVFRGEFPTPNYDIEIRRLKNGPDGLTVFYRNIDHLEGLASPRFPIQPYHLKKIPAFSGPVNFELKD